MIDQLRPTGLRVPAEAPPPLQSFSTTTRERLTSELAVFTSALRFNHILRVASERGRAHFRDMSVARAGAWLRARPPRDDEDLPPFTRFPVGGLRIEHQAALLLRPPGTSRFCHGCWEREAWSSYLHFGSCSHGVRLTPVLHHPVKHVLIQMLRSVFRNSRVLDGDATPGGFTRNHGEGAEQREQWWHMFSRYKRPDIIITNYPDSGRHTLIDVKTFDAAGASHVRSDHTDYHTLGAHRELERSLIREYLTERRRDESGRRHVVATHSAQRAIYGNELLCAAVSRQGAVGEQLLGLIRRLAGMHSQLARDGQTASYSFEAVWRHRLSLCVHTQAASQMLTLVSAGAEAGGDEAEAEEELDAAEGMTASWMHTWFTAIADVEPGAADAAADAAVAGVMQRAAGVGGMPAVDPTVAGDEGEAEAEEQCEECVRCGQSECVCEAEAEEQCEECVGCGQSECVCEVVWREVSEAEEEDGEVAHAFEEVPGSHRPPHPEFLSSGPEAPSRASGVPASPCVPCPGCGQRECRCEVQRVWSRGVWRERDEVDALD